MRNLLDELRRKELVDLFGRAKFLDNTSFEGISLPLRLIPTLSYPHIFSNSFDNTTRIFEFPDPAIWIRRNDDNTVSSHDIVLLSHGVKKETSLKAALTTSYQTYTLDRTHSLSRLLGHPRVRTLRDLKELREGFIIACGYEAVIIALISRQPFVIWNSDDARVIAFGQIFNCSDRFVQSSEDIARSRNTFQREDFDAIVEKMRPFMKDLYTRLFRLMEAATYLHGEILQIPNKTLIPMVVCTRILGSHRRAELWGCSQSCRTITGREEAIKYLFGQEFDMLLKESFCTVPKMFEEMENISSELVPLNISFDWEDYLSYRGVHVSGWWAVVEALLPYRTKNGIFLDLYLDRTFGWEYALNKYLGKIPYTRPWIGFFHHTDFSYITANHLRNVFQHSAFLDSLPACQALLTLTEDNASRIRSLLPQEWKSIPVFSIIHPLAPLPSFDPSRFFAKNPKKLVHIGAHYRNSFGIYRARVPSDFRKYILKGKDMERILPPSPLRIQGWKDLPLQQEEEILDLEVPCRHECNTWVIGCIDWLIERGLIRRGNYVDGVIYVDGIVREVELILNEMIASVTILENLSNDEYIAMLQESIVFLYLYDAAAVNTVLECARMGTPLLVNPLPGVREVLGDNYPLYFNDFNLIPGLLLNHSIERAIEYLALLDQEQFSMENFIRRIRIVTELVQPNLLEFNPIIRD